jgi:hypothetical protein
MPAALPSSSFLFTTASADFGAGLMFGVLLRLCLPSASVAAGDEFFVDEER